MASIRQKGSKYEVRLRINGRSISKTFSSSQKAQHYALSVELGFDEPKTQPTEFETTDLTLSEALWNYHRQCGSRKKGVRQEKERIVALHQYDWIEQSVTAITPTHIRSMRDELIAKGRSGSTVRLMMSTLRAVYRFAKNEWGLDIGNPAAEVKMPAPPTPRSRRLLPTEHDALMKALGQCRNRYPRPAAQLSLETGLRQAELLGLQWDDIDHDRGIVHLKDTKNSHPRWVPLTQRAREILRQLPRDSERVLPITRSLLIQAWSHALARAGINDLRWHDLRHEALSRWSYHLGGDVHKLALISGHRTLQMSMRYVHPVQSEMLAANNVFSIMGNEKNFCISVK